MSRGEQLAGAGTLTETQGQYEVRFVRHYARPVEQLWRAISSPEGLDAWYPTKLRTDGVVGNRVTETFELPDGSPPQAAPPGYLTAYEPQHVFEYRIEGPDEAPYAGMLGEQTIRMEAQPAGEPGHSTLVFTHWVQTLPTALDVITGWHYCLDYLAQSLGAGRAPTSEDHERYKAHYFALYGHAT